MARISYEQEQKYIDIYLQLGRMLFQYGATVSRTIDSIGQVKQYLGGDDIHVMIDYDGLIVTDINGQKYHTKIESRRAFGGINIKVLIEVSKFIRNINNEKPTLDKIKERLAAIAHVEEDVHGLLQHVNMGFMAVCFGFLNGADIFAVIAIFPAAVILSFVKKTLLLKKYNLYIATMLAALTAIVLSGIVTLHLPTTTALVAVIAVVLPQVPGFPMINAGIDILHNHNSVGLGRIAFALMMTGALAIAVCAPMLIFFNVLQVEPNVDMTTWQAQLTDVLFAAAAAAGLGLCFNVPYRYLGFLSVGAFVARGVRTEMVVHNVDMVTAAFCGAVCAAIIAFAVNKKYHFPTGVFALLCVLPMIPGFLAINGINNLFLLSKLPVNSISFEFVVATIQTLLKTGFTMCALLAGVIFPVFLLEGRSLRI